jgi:hypothetical protein
MFAPQARYAEAFGGYLGFERVRTKLILPKKVLSFFRPQSGGRVGGGILVLQTEVGQLVCSLAE